MWSPSKNLLNNAISHAEFISASNKISVLGDPETISKNIIDENWRQKIGLVSYPEGKRSFVRWQ